MELSDKNREKKIEKLDDMLVGTEEKCSTAKLLKNREENQQVEEYEARIKVLQKQIESKDVDLQLLQLDNNKLVENLQNFKLSETEMKLQIDDYKRSLDSISELQKKAQDKLQEYEQDHLQINAALKDLKTCRIILTDISIDDDQFTILEKINLLMNYFKHFEQNYLQTNENEDPNKVIDNGKFLENELKKMKTKCADLLDINNDLALQLTQIQNDMKKLENEKTNIEKQCEKLQTENNWFRHRYPSVVNPENNRCLTCDLEQLCEKVANLESENASLLAEKIELSNRVQEEHLNSIHYYDEVCRLNGILNEEATKTCIFQNAVNTNTIVATKQKEIDKLTDENDSLKTKCDTLLQNFLAELKKSDKLLVEKNLFSEKEAKLIKEINRLSNNLVEMQDMYSVDIVRAMENNRDLAARLYDLEQRQHFGEDCSPYERMLQENNALKTQIRYIKVQRDSLLQQVTENLEKNRKQSAALINLQTLIEKIRRNQESEIKKETEKIRVQFTKEQKMLINIETENAALKNKLETTLQKLKESTILIEASNKRIHLLDNKDKEMKNQLAKLQEMYRLLLKDTDSTIDKILIKNLVLGFLQATKTLNQEQFQVVKLLATVLNFTEEEHKKININKNISKSWLSNALKQLSPPLVNPEMPINDTPPPTSSTSVHSSGEGNDFFLLNYEDFLDHQNSSTIL